MVIKTTAASRVTPTPRVGKLVRGALYVHCDAVDLVPAASQDRVALAIRAAPSAQWNVVRIELTSVGLLDYDEFDSRAFPRLLRSAKVGSRGEETTYRDYRRSSNPLILHRKELLVRPDHPQRAEWTCLTDRLESLGLFADPTRIGRLKQWNQLLAAVNLDPEGRQL